MKKQLYTIWLSVGLISGICSSLFSAPFFFNGRVHEAGVQFTLNTKIEDPLKPWFFGAEAATACLRALLTLQTHALLNDASASAEIKKAGISLVSLCNEVLHILNSPASDHTIDATWAVTDGLQALKHLKNCGKALVDSDKKGNLLLEVGLDVHEPEMTLSPKAYALLEGVCALLSVMPSATAHGAFSNKSRNDFMLRSALSTLRLMRNKDYAEEFNGEKNLYNMLIAAQLLFVGGKLYTQPFRGNMALVRAQVPDIVFTPATVVGGDSSIDVTLQRVAGPNQVISNNICAMCQAAFTEIDPFLPGQENLRIACLPCGHVFCAHEISRWWDARAPGCPNNCAANAMGAYRELVRQYDFNRLNHTITFAQQGLPR